MFLLMNCIALQYARTEIITSKLLFSLKPLIEGMMTSDLVTISLFETMLIQTIDMFHIS